jgi:two-component system chemotaxis response regulator CheY
MGTILIVDDTAMLRKAMQLFLEDTGLEVAEAENGADALTWLRTNMPLAIVLDVDMPVMDGLATLRMIRSKPDYASVKVVMASTRGTADVIKDALLAGANEYLIKPFTREMILQKLARVGVAVEV